MIGDLPYERRELEFDDQRTPTQRDRDRILYCSAFRRLSGVTQVVSPEEGHIFHNRLTHSLEVAQIGRRLAERLLTEYEDTAVNLYNIDVDSVEAACLAHDLGHPPFGHAAEYELNRLISEDHHELDGYEGNAQSFRITTKLAVRGPFLGLNLTRTTLNAILKYPWLRSRRDRKWGAYRIEREVFDWVRNGTEGKTPSIEAAIMTWADDIAYSIHDTEDFYRAGLIPLDRLSGSKSDERRRFLTAVCERWGADGRDTSNFTKYERSFNDFCKTYLFVSEPYSGTRSQRYSLRSLTSLMIGAYLNDTVLTDRESQPLRFADSKRSYEMEMLKELTWHYVILGPTLASQQEGHRRIIRTLFDVFSNACFGSSKAWTVLPPRFKEEMQILHTQYGDAIGHELRIRTAADAVAGLTDIEAIRFFQRLTGAQPGSAIDPIVS